MLSIKSRITPVIEKLPPYFEIGQIKLYVTFGVTLTMIFTELNLTADPSCVCGNPCEHAFHFFFEYPIYDMCRLEMENTMVIISIPISLNLLLNGRNALTHEENTHIVLNVQR